MSGLFIIRSMTETLVLNKEVSVQNSGPKLLCSRLYMYWRAREKVPFCRSWKAKYSHFLKTGSKYQIFRISLILILKSLNLWHLLLFDSTFRSCTKVHFLRTKVCWSIQFHNSFVRAYSFCRSVKLSYSMVFERSDCTYRIVFAHFDCKLLQNRKTVDCSTVMQ